MDPEAIINLFDSCWFNLEIFKKHSITSSSINSDKNPDHKIQDNLPEQKISSLPAIHLRPKSEQLSSKTSFNSQSLSPNSVLFTPHLQTIVSVKEEMPEGSITPQNIEESVTETSSCFLNTKTVSSVSDSNLTYVDSPQALYRQESTRASYMSFLQEKKLRKMRRSTKKKLSKSLSELEFEELKGFMDLGFVFSEEDKDSSLVEIIPGLQRLGKNDGEEKESTTIVVGESSSVSRPYLSEAWEVLDTRHRENPLMNWRVPALSNEIGMKDSLKLWAHTVASAVI